MADDTLTILKGKDCTDTIISLVRKDNHLYEAQFTGSHKRYLYRDSDVQLLSRKRLVDSEVYIAVVGGLVQRKVVEIQDFDTFVRIVYESGYKKTLHKSEVKLVKSLLDEPGSRERFDYFKAVAHRVGLRTDDGSSILGTGIDDLIRYMRYQGSVENEGALRSVFDYLYRSYYKNRTRKAWHNSSPAEYLMNELLQLMRADGELGGIGMKMEYPLGELCKTTLLSPEEQRFAQWSRVDFVLFRELSKEPILAIEVDGWAFHDSKVPRAMKQKERDGMKDAILQKAGLPLARFSTTGSGERQKLLRLLKSLQ